MTWTSFEVQTGKPQPPERRKGRYFLAVAAPVAGFLLNLVLPPGLGRDHPFVALLPAVFAAAGYGGFGPGLLAAGLSAALALYPLLLYPPYSLPPGKTADIIAIFAFTTIGVLVSWLAGSLLAAKRNAEAQARQSREDEARTRQTLDSISDAYATLDKDWRFTFVNQRASHLCGKYREELVGSILWELFPGAAGTEPYREVHRAVRDNVPVRFELFWERISVWLEIDAYPVAGGLVVLGRDVTERRRADEALRNTSETLGALVQASPLPIVALTAGGAITLWNTAAEKLFGWTAEEVLGRPIPFVPPEKQEEHRTMRARDLEGRGFTNLELSRRRKDGSPIEISVSTAPMRNAAGAVTGIMSVYLDVTERKRADAALRESEEKFRALFDSSRDALGIATGGTHLYVNAAYARLFGYDSPDDLAGRPIYDVIAPEHREEMRRRSEGRARGEPIPTFYQTRGLRRDGSEIDLELRVSSFMVARQLHTLAIIRDITAEKRAAEELRRSEERYKVFVSQSAEGIWRMELDEPLPVDEPVEEQVEKLLSGAHIVECNDAMARMHGFLSASELAGTRLRDLLGVSDKNEDYLKRFILSGYKLSDAESHEMERSTEQRYFLNNLMGIVEAGFLVRIWGTKRDVTESRYAAEALALQAQELARSNADLQQFAYITSHDLQEPLRMISSYAQMLERRYRDRLDDDAKEFIGYMVGGAQRMGALIRDLLSYSRVVNADEMPLESVSLESTLEWALMNLQLAIDDSGAEVTSDPLPVVSGNQVQLLQLLQNLVGNAIKYRSRQRPCIHVAAQPKAGGWIVSVRDNGIGIAPEYHE
ncbi:MAG: PAS domain S-box protein, partial [Bryobacteraceae bacterium]